MKTIRRLISILTCAALSLSLLSTSAFAMKSDNDPADTSPNTYMYEIEDGYVFTQKANDKSVAIITDNVEKVIAISIIYNSTPNNVYQWIIYDYPMDDFFQNSVSTWNNIITYAEDNLDDASLVEISIDKADGNTRGIHSSAGADLAADLVSIVGNEYSDKFVKSKIMDGHTYRLYETMEFFISKYDTLSWKSGTSIASILVSIIGVVASGTNIGGICGVLGIVGGAASTVLPGGKINRYSCMVLYTRYVTVDYGSTQYGRAYKIRQFDGYEDADLNSTGRAHVFSDTEILYYDANQSEEYFNNGIFDEAYNAYNNIL